MDRATLNGIRGKYGSLSPALDERQRRLWAAAEARALGRGGLALVVRATGLAKTTVLRGMEEVAADRKIAPGHVRRRGGGRKSLTTLDPGLVRAMERLVEPVTRGDPESPLRWTAKSTRHLARELSNQGHPHQQRSARPPCFGHPTLPPENLHLQ
ncbi:MAG: ISAzo13-like element transposase-related protein, partial [Phycisphaerae bacterium]